MAAGLGDTLRIEPNLVRIAFVLLGLAGGVGLALYVGAYFLMRAPDEDAPPAAVRAESDPVQVAALAAVVVGLLLLVRALGWWPGDALMVPLAAAAVGLGLLWVRPGDPEVSEVPDLPVWLSKLPPAAAESVKVLVGTRRGAVTRLAVGAFLVFTGMLVLLGGLRSWELVRVGVLAPLVVTLGLALALGPGLWHMATELTEERRERIRSQERAEMGAHLHDSVLQTLALVQRRADDPREVVRLARRQERELRAWLLDPNPDTDTAPESLGIALERAAADLEEQHGIPVEVVRVRDCPLDEHLQPLLQAAREAMLNAIRHSGAASVSVYLEVEPEKVTVFVRDTGRGFDLAAVAPDRRGVAESIVGRLARNGGTATVRTAPGEGTQVELVLPRVSS